MCNLCIVRWRGKINYGARSRSDKQKWFGSASYSFLNASLHICAFLPRFCSPLPSSGHVAVRTRASLINRFWTLVCIYLRILPRFFLTSSLPAPRAVFSSKRVKGFLENAGQRDLLAQFQSIEAEMASRMKSECFILIFSVLDPDSLSSDPDPALYRLNTHPDPGCLWQKKIKKFITGKNFYIFLIKNCNLLIPRPPQRKSKLQEKPSVLKKRTSSTSKHENY